MKKFFVTLFSVYIMLNIICLANAKTADELIVENKNTYSSDLASVKTIANEQIYDGAGDNISFDNSLAEYIYTDKYGGDYDDTFESHLSDDYFWVVFSNGNRKAFRYDSSLSKWKDSGSGTLNSFYDKDNNPININFNFDTIVNIACQKINDSLEAVKLVRYDGVYIIYAKSADSEYTIPYSSISDRLGINNGEVYAANDLIKIISGENEQNEIIIQNETIAQNQMTSEEQMTYGGGGTTATPDDTTQLEQSPIEEQPEQQGDTEKIQITDDTPKDKSSSQLLTIIVLSLIVVSAVIVTVVSVTKHKKH